MSCCDELIRSFALKRIASLFAVAAESLSQDARFGTELRAKPRTFFRDNAFDEIEGDIMDAADRNLRHQMERGEYQISTVGAYCDHMVRCYALRPKMVEKILGLPKE